MVIITVKREQTQSINKIWINFLHVGPAEKTLPSNRGNREDFIMRFPL